MVAGTDLNRARLAKAKALSLFTDLGQVNGVGITRVGNGYGLKINLSERPAEGIELPDEVDGVPILVEFVGAISKRPLPSLKS